MSEPLIQQTSTTSFEKLEKKPVIYVCQANQFNYTR